MGGFFLKKGGGGVDRGEKKGGGSGQRVEERGGGQRG